MRAVVRRTISRVGDLLRHAYIRTAANRELYISSVNSVLPTHVYADNRYCLIFRSLRAFFLKKMDTGSHDVSVYSFARIVRKR